MNDQENWRAYCPRCEGFLRGGFWFSGRTCGSCFGETVSEADLPKVNKPKHDYNSCMYTLCPICVAKFGG